MKRFSPLALSIALTGLLLIPGPPRGAAAEGFLDLRLGAAFPENGDVDSRSTSGPFTTALRTRAEWDTSFTTGVRGGYWFENEANFIGVGLDLSYYGVFEDTSTAPLDIVAFPVSPLLMVRIPLGPVDEDFPGGRVQPYGAIGPAFTLSAAHGDVSELGFGSDDFTDSSFDVGLDARGGLAIQVARPIALFAEYRYTRLRPEYDDEVDVFVGPDVDIDVDPDLDVHHLTFGVSFRF